MGGRRRAPPGAKLLPPVRFLEIEPTTRCNFTCGFCCGRHMVQQDLELATFRAALEAFPEADHLELQGEGEPLLQPRFFEMAALARERGLRVCCITNGSLLSPDNVGRILDLSLDKVMVSFESLDPATFQRLRGGKLEKVLEGLERLSRTRAARGLERPAVGLAVTVLKETLGELPAFVALYRRLALDGGIDFQPLNPMPGYLKHYAAELLGQFLSDRDLRLHLETLHAEPVYGIAFDGSSAYRGFFSELFDDFKPGSRRCPWLERGAYVTADGSITPCCTIKDGARAGFGKVGEGPWQREAKRRAMAAELLEGRTPAPCEGCAIAAAALAAPSAADFGALELEFSWVHTSSLALQRDIGTRLAPAITDAVVRLEELRRPEPESRREPHPASDESEKARLASELAAAQARVEGLLASQSWRLTAPLRALHKLLGLQRR